MCAAWESRAPLLLGAEAPPPPPLLPRYTGVAWRFGVALSPAPSGAPSGGGALPPVDMAPFVQLQLCTAAPGGGEALTPLELSLPEFRELAKSLRAAARVMATV